MCGERKDNCVLYEKDRHVARITLNKPEKRNALDEELGKSILNINILQINLYFLHREVT